MRLGFLELAVILAIMVLVIGPTQIPKLTSAIGDSMKKFKEEYKKEDNPELTSSETAEESSEK